jgi:hypothetical protein
MYKLLAKYGYRAFMEGEGAGGGGAGDGAAGGDGAAADAGKAAPQTALERAAAAGTGEPKKEGEEPAGDAWKEYVPDPAKSEADNAAAKAEHDKTKPAVKDGEVDPTSYKIDPPEGFEVDDGVMTEFRGLAAKNKWTQEHVDQLKGLQVKLYEKQAEAVATQSAKWGDEITADKELGGPDHDAKMAKAGAFLNEFFDAPTVKLLTSSGLGNYPGLIRGFYRAGLAMGEAGTLRGGKPAGGAESLADRLYGERK